MKTDKIYYEISRKASSEIDSPVTSELIKVSEGATKILDLGCGEGTRLSLLFKDAQKYGIDHNEYAISKGRKVYPGLHLIKGDLGNLSFKDEEFDLVFSAFVLEHLDDPEKILLEAIRVLKPGGVLFLAAPNYGAPDRRSPCNFENKYLKIIKGFFCDFVNIVRRIDKLEWKKVKPRTEEPFQIDFDTTIEPYIFGLERYLKTKNLLITKSSSLWCIPEVNNSILFKMIRKLGLSGLFPFKYWGPQLLIIAHKL